MRIRQVSLAIGLLLGAQRVALACPFCGGKGATGLLENLLIVAGLWFGARALMRFAQRRRRARPPDSETAADGHPSAGGH